MTWEDHMTIAETLLPEFDQEMATTRRGERVIFSLPRGPVVRQHINHLVHHRGQLTVYLRLVDVAVPSIYGPAADEQMPGF
jgi:uncharacterized damage-inducible protein DinB